MNTLDLSSEQHEQWKLDGYIIVRGLFDAEEMEILRTVAKNDRALEEHTHGLADGEGGVQKLSLWNKAGDDIYGLVARSTRIVDRMEVLLGDEVYHYHSKMSIKEPFTGGAWAWHQDYGYWYNNGFLLPDMGSCFIAVDANTKENGCMQVLKGSHLMGRIEHGKFGDQTGADPERTDAAMQVMELVYAEMEPGDALFFHSNTLHRSGQNSSVNPRWSLICCYSTRHNTPFKTAKGPSGAYEKIEKVDDEAIKRAGANALSGTTEFWAPPEKACSNADLEDVAG